MRSPDETARLLIAAWKLLVARLPTGRIEHADGAVSCLGHVPLSFLNLSTHDGPIEDAAALRRYFETVDSRTASCGHPSMIALCDDWLPQDWQQVAAEQGQAMLMYLTGMETDALQPPRRPAPSLDLRRVTDEATARDLATVNAHAYGMPPELFECVCNTHLWHEDSHAFVAYVDGRAVSGAAALPVDGTVYVGFVATMPDMHGKGYAEAVMRHAVAECQRTSGLTRTTLHASDMGRPLYESMGYAPSARFTVLGRVDAH